MALLYEAQGDYAKAEPLFIRASQISRDLLDLTAAVQSERKQLLLAADLRYRLDDYLTVALHSKAVAAPAYGHVLAWKDAVFQRQRRLHLERDAADSEAAMVRRGSQVPGQPSAAGPPSGPSPTGQGRTPGGRPGSGGGRYRNRVAGSVHQLVKAVRK